MFHVHRELLLPWVLPVLLLLPLSRFSGADAESRHVRRHHGTPFPALASCVGCWYLGGEPSPPPPGFHPTTVGACATMAWTYGASRCSECGVTKANPAAMRRHTLTQHRHLGRNANRRLPPQQHGPDPAVGQAGAAAAARQGAEASPAASCPPTSSPSRQASAAVADAVEDGQRRPESDCDADDEALLLQLADEAALHASQQDADAPRAAAKQPLSGHEVEGLGGGAHARSSVCTEAQAEYERIGDSKRCEPAVKARPHCRPGLFNTPALRLMQAFVNEANGSGLSIKFQTMFYEMMAKWDGSADDKQPAGTPNRIKDHFSSANAFRNAVCDDLDEAVLSSGWKKCTMVQGGVRYVSFFRSALMVALEALHSAKEVQLRRDDVEVGDRRQSPMDGEAFKAHQEAIDAVTVEKAFVLGVYVYSDASLLSWSGGTFPMQGWPCLLCLCSGLVPSLSGYSGSLTPHLCRLRSELRGCFRFEYLSDAPIPHAGFAQAFFVHSLQPTTCTPFASVS